MQQRPSGHSPRGRPAAPDPSPLPPSSPPPPHRHIFPDAQAPLPPPPLPSALVPPKKRRVLRPPRKAATPIPPPPPPPTPTPALAAPVPAAGMLAVSDPSPLPPVDGSGVLTPPCTGAEDEEPFATARPVPDADAELSSVPPPAPDATAKPARVRRVRKVIRKVIVKKVVPKGTLAARKAAAAAAAAYGASKSGGETPADKPANDHGAATGKSVGKEQGANEAVVAKPVTNRNAIAAPAAAAGALTSRGETPTDKPTNDQDAATGESVGQEQHRDETVVQKLATDCTIIAAPTAAGALKSRGEISTEKLTNDQDAAADKLAGKEQDVNETIVEKPATNCNAVAVRGSLGKETAAEGLAGKTLARKPVIDCNARGGDGVGMSERQRTRMKEVFVGGLDRDAKEEDVRAVFAKVGDITQVRMIMDVHTRKNKGYCFVRYCEAAQAKKAIAKFGKVKICGEFCRTAAPDASDIISLGNIDKKWKKEDIINLLHKIGVENVHTVTITANSNKLDSNLGFALLELQTSRHVQVAYKKLSKKGVFGKGLNIRVAWVEKETLNDPDETDMHKVKSIFVEGIPSSWGQAKVTEIFKNYGKIEHMFLSRNMQLDKKKDVACIKYMTHEAAILCLESFDKEELTENGSKVNIKVLANPVQKNKQNKEEHTFSISEDDKRVAKSNTVQTAGDKKSSTNHDLLHVSRGQATWRHGHIFPAPIQDHRRTYSGGKRPSSRLDDDSSDHMRSHSRPRHGSSTYTTSTLSDIVLLPATTRSSLPSFHDNSRCSEGLVTRSSISNQAIMGSRARAALWKQALPKILTTAKDDTLSTQAWQSVYCKFSDAILGETSMALLEHMNFALNALVGGKLVAAGGGGQTASETSQRQIFIDFLQNL